MTDLGYVPSRIASLSRAVRLALDELHELRCHDPAGDDAMRVVALTAHNLEHTWRPMLARIETSASMAAWDAVAAGLHVGGWRSPWGGRTNIPSGPSDPHSSVTRDVEGTGVIAALARGAGAIRFGPDGHPIDGDLGGPGHRRISDTIVHLLRIDPRFAASLVDLVRRQPEASWLLLDRRIDPATRAEILQVVLSAGRSTPGHRWERLAAAADALMSGLVHDPDAILDVLTDRVALDMLADWTVLDQGVVAAFVQAGLGSARRDDVRRHRRGTTVLAHLVDVANASWIDHRGFGRGMSLGVAASIGAYAPSFIDTLRSTAGTVAIRGDGVEGRVDVTLGTHEEVVDLVGAVIRNSREAADQIGVEIAALARLAVAGGPDLPVSVRVDTVADFANLARRAASNEEAERAIAASARRSAMRDSATLFGLSAAATMLLLRGAGPVAGLVLDRGVVDTVDLATRPRPAAPLDAPDYGTSTHDVLVTAAARRLVDDDDLRRIHAPDANVALWRSIESTLADLDRRAVDGSRHEIDRLMYDVEALIRRAGAGPYLDEILRTPSVHELTQSSTPAD